MAKSQHAATDVVAVADRCPVNAAADDAGFAVSTLHTDATRAELVAVGQLDLATCGCRKPHPCSLAPASVALVSLERSGLWVCASST